jgi:hypothetical protein
MKLAAAVAALAIRVSLRREGQGSAPPRRHEGLLLASWCYSSYRSAISALARSSASR